MVSLEISGLPSDLVRRTGPGVVLTILAGTLTATTMRWGFSRPLSDAINIRANPCRTPTSVACSDGLQDAGRRARNK